VQHCLVLAAIEMPPRTPDFARIASAIMAEEDPAFDPWLQRESGLASADGAARYGRHRDDVLAFGRVTNVAGLTVMEAGCGFGFGLIWYALHGATALGVELHAAMVDTISAYKRLLPVETANRVHAQYGNASSMPYDDASIDVVISNEAISHYLDVAGFIRESHRVIRPGGVLLIMDANNSLDPRVRRRNHRWYREVEFGPVDGVGIFTKPFSEKRRDLIASLGLDGSEGIELARRTSGLDADGIRAAVIAYASTGALPNAIFTADTVPVDPETGQAIERLINPYGLARRLRQAGFKSTRVGGYWGGATGKPVVRAANAVLERLSPLTIYTTRSFRVAAWR
jgi:SAM-dependent methyltransferase